MTAQGIENKIVEICQENNVSGIVDRQGQGGSVQVPLGDRLLMLFWYMASKDKYASSADRFGISESTASYAIRNLMAFISGHLLHRVIVWPTQEEMQEMQDLFSEASNFPGVCGIIDATHIEIRKPSNRGIDHYNRKEFYSIILQGVVAENLLFTNVFVGFPGKVHDARVFKHSPLFQTGQELCENGHLLGDSAYPNIPWLITPFRDNGHLTQVQRRYNIIHSSIRSSVERAFGLLKGRFPRLQYIDQRDIKTIVQTVLTGCVMHNICILNNDELEDLFKQEPVVQGLPDGYGFDQYDQNRAALKRLEIARRL